MRLDTRRLQCLYNGQRGAGTFAAQRHKFCAGGAGGVHSHSPLLSRCRRRHRAGRRGRQNNIHNGWYRTAHERQLCRRHGRLHRPDGNAFEYQRGADGCPRLKGAKGLPHSVPLRRVCKVGYPAAHKPGRQKGGYFRLHIPGSRRPDGFGSRPGQAHKGQGALFGRTSALFKGSSKGICHNAGSWRQCRIPRGCALLYGYRRGAQFGGRQSGKPVVGHSKALQRARQRRAAHGQSSVFKQAGVCRLCRSPQGDGFEILRYRHLFRRCLSRYRFGFYNYETHFDNARLPHPLFALSVQQRSAPRYSRAKAARNLCVDGRQSNYTRQRCHGLWRRPHQGGDKGRFRHS